MATRAKHRDPLLEPRTRAFLQRRGREALGLVLIVCAVATAALLGSYSPDDPGWLAATDAPAHNLLGRFGAGVASPLHVITGRGAWAIALVLGGWGGRFVLHRGEERVTRRALLAPLVVALASVYAATHTPPASWSHAFGLGGLFGDTALGAMLRLVPLGAALGLKVVSALTAAALLAMTVFVLGFDRPELAYLARAFAGGLRRAAATTVPVLLRVGKSVGRLGVSGARRLAPRRGNRDAGGEDDGSPVASPPWEQGVRSGRLTGVLPALLAPRRNTPEESARPARVEPPLARGGVRAAEATIPWRADPGAGGGALPAHGAPVQAPAAARGGTGGRGSRHDTAGAGRPEAHPATAAGTDADSGVVPPPLDLLTDPAEIERLHLPPEALQENARALETVLADYGVKGEIVHIRPGPVVTMYELEPAPGLKASRVIGLADDIARSMSALSARVSTVPGRSVIGIELPNSSREQVLLREMLGAEDFADPRIKLPLALGKEIGGEPVVANLARMPHLLIAGTTGSGKSVAINTMILSLLYRLSPEECRLIMIDPKMLELSVYDQIPHLLSPVVTDPKKAVVALKWVVAEMEDRYRKMSKMGVRNIEGYNGRVREAVEKGEMFSRTVQTGFDDETGAPVFETEEFAPETMPYIVVIVDEMADLMMVAGKEIEACIQRLAQMARASGIHLIMATQRPSVDVITGTIKANFPTRISFSVTSKVDSRTILGEQGAEQLLGMGDMLYMAGGAKITRVHGPFVSDREVEEVVAYLKAFGPPDYVEGVADGPEDSKESDIDQVLGLGSGGGSAEGDDLLYDQAVAIAAKERKCSTSFIQRKLAIGYNKAARLVEQMEEQGVVSSANRVGKREILVPEQQ